MKIGIDVSKLNKLSKNRGIGFYTQNLIESLKKYTDVEIEVIEENDKKIKVDITHYPSFDFFKHTLPISKKTKTVVTIHDVIPLLFPKQYPPGIKGQINLSLQKLALKNVSAVIADSESSKKDIAKAFKFNQDKIFSVYLAADPSFKIIKDESLKNQIKKKYQLVDKFVLFVGDVNWNKNLVNLTKAAVDSGVDIYFVGKAFEDKTNLNHPEKKSFKEFLNQFENNPKVHILGFIHQEDLVGIMNLATVLLFPSFYEGFGLPILEAQSCGLPVITSNVSSMPEVGGEGALLVDPNDQEEIKQKLQNLLENDEARNQLIKRGEENIKGFSWKQTALDTLKVYEKILS